MLRFWITTVGALVLWSSIAVSGAQPARAQAALNDRTLSGMLSSLGYAPKKWPRGYLVTFMRDSWTINLEFLLSSDGMKLGISSSLGNNVKTDAVKAGTWMNLLAANRDLDPDFFFYDKANRQLYLHRSLDNHGITAASLRSQIDAFISHIMSTRDLWTLPK